MALHFTTDEYENRLKSVCTRMESQKLDAILLFSQESMYWLTGYDTFGFCFFQCMVVHKDGHIVLLTRAPDLRQAKHTSIVDDIRIWVDQGSSSPITQLIELLTELKLHDSRLGVEFDTHGLTGKNGQLLDESLRSFTEFEDSSEIILQLRAIKSPAEIKYIRKAANLGDEAFNAALHEIRPGADEGKILAILQGKIFEGGGDYPGNEFIIGSHQDALLCRYKSGRRKLSSNDQITLEFAGVYRHYHAALMRTVIVGQPHDRQIELYEAARSAIIAVEDKLCVGNTFGDVFDAHATTLDNHGLKAHRLNACGYSLGAKFSPSWMDWPMFYHGNSAEILPNMSLFVHIILMDSDLDIAMTLGRTYLTTNNAPEPLSGLNLDLPIIK